MPQEYILIEKLEQKNDTKSYDDVKPDRYLRYLCWSDSNGYPTAHWTDDPDVAIRWHDKEYAKHICAVLNRKKPYPIRVITHAVPDLSHFYTELTCLGDIVKHMGEPLLFGYGGTVEYPDYAWVQRPVKVISPCSEKGDYDPDAEIDGLGITTDSTELVVMYDGNHPKNKGKWYRHVHAYKEDYGDEYFDGQLFCRTLTPAEKKIYNKVSKWKYDPVDGKELETYLDIYDKEVSSSEAWR